MPEPITDEMVAQRIWENLKTQAKGIAELSGPAPKTRKLTPAEEALLWMTEAKGWTPEKELALLNEGKSREAVGLLKYPERQKLMERGDRALSKLAQARYAAEMAKKIDPTWQPPPRPDALPEPLAALEGADETPTEARPPAGPLDALEV